MGRMVVRNRQPFWYALYETTVASYGETDEYGNPIQTGTYPVYGEVHKAYGNISAAKGEVDARQFGDADNYDKVIVLGDRDTPIDEYAVLWIDREEPVTDLYGKPQIMDGKYVTPWDYEVTKVGRGLPGFGSAVIAVRKVNVR